MLTKVIERRRSAALLLLLAIGLAGTVLAPAAQAGGAQGSASPHETLTRDVVRAKAGTSSTARHTAGLESVPVRASSARQRSPAAIRQPAVLAVLGASFAFLGVLTRVRYRSRPRR